MHLPAEKAFSIYQIFLIPPTQCVEDFCVIFVSMCVYFLFQDVFSSCVISGIISLPYMVEKLYPRCRWSLLVLVVFILSVKSKVISRLTIFRDVHNYVNSMQTYIYNFYRMSFSVFLFIYSFYFQHSFFSIFLLNHCCCLIEKIMFLLYN